MLNFLILVEIDTIIAEVDEIRNKLEEKVYRTSKDNIQLTTTKVLITLFTHLVKQIESDDQKDQDMDKIQELSQNIMYFWTQNLSKIQYQGFDMITVILFLHQIKSWIEKVDELQQL